MTLIDEFPLIFGGLAFALSMGMVFVGRNAIRRIRGHGREDPRTLWRLGMIRFFTASIVLIGLFISASLLLVQIDHMFGLIGPVDDVVGFSICLACGAWYLNAIVLGSVTDSQGDAPR